jgi:LemA protein
MKVIVAVGAGLLLAVVGFFGCAYSKRNQIIDLDEQAKAKWAHIDANLQRRLDLVPNLVNTVQGTAKFESETQIKVTEKRNQLLAVADALKETPREPAQAEKLDRLNSELFAAMRAFTGLAAEAYPQLRATEAFRDLMAQLEGTENRIGIARRDYNDAAASYNAMVRKWKWLPFCGGFEPNKPVFQATPEAQKAPEVKF